MDLGLKQYQVDGIAWLRRQDRAILGDEMGVGKTVQALFAAHYLGSKLIFVVAAASLRKNWENEYKKWGFISPLQIFEKTTDKLKKDTTFAIFSYQTFVAFAKANSTLVPDLIIFDEAHLLKDPTTIRAKVTFEFARKARRVWFLTGTPLPNNISNAWTLFYFCSKGALPKFWAFAEEYGYVRNIQVSPRRSVKKAVGCRSSKMEALVAKVKPFMLRRTVEEVLPELPDYEEIVIPLTPCREAKAILDRAEPAREALRKKIDGETLSPEEEAQLVSLSTLREELGVWKAKDCEEFIQNLIEQNEPVVVGVHHQSTANYLSSLKGKIGVINGATPMASRQGIVDKFQEGELDALVLGIQAAGLGYTLTRARIQVLVEMTYVPTELQQFQARIRRLGQRQSCLYYFMVYPGTIDELVYERVLEKAKDLRKFYNAYEGKAQETEKQEEINWGQIDIMKEVMWD